MPNSYVSVRLNRSTASACWRCRAPMLRCSSRFTAPSAKSCGSLTGWGGREDTSGRSAATAICRARELAARRRATLASMKEYSGAQAIADADAAASVMLDTADLPSDFEGALARLLEALRASLPARFAPVLQPDQLVAAQPNVHGGLRFYHLDEPLHDGFGVIIVTVAVAGGGRILLQRGRLTRRGGATTASRWRKGARVRSERRRAEHVPARRDRRRWQPRC